MSLATTPRAATVQDRIEAGKTGRGRLPRRLLGHFEPDSTRPNPMDVLKSQETQRVAELIPIRHERMSANPFAFYRGAAAVMAHDLGSQPNSGLSVQLCGDAHLSNLGLFAGPDRRLVFDLNDFDETSPGPFEWDVHRLATSFQIAALAAGHRPSFAASLPSIVAESYRTSMFNFSQMNDLDVWYYRIDTDELKAWALRAKSKSGLAAIEKTATAATAKDRWSAVKSLTTIVDGQRRFKDQPPLLARIPDSDGRREFIADMYGDYRKTLLVDRAELLSHYRWIDVGHKVVGVGSVGLLAFVLLLQGRDENDLLVLQIKQAVASVLEPVTAPTTWSSAGERVVSGQRLIQASTDAFLGFAVGPQGRQYYVRQLRDMKWGPDPLTMNLDAYRTYAALCGLTLARAHARSGDAIAISSYMGNSQAFAGAIARFADSYTKQNELDFTMFASAVVPLPPR